MSTPMPERRLRIERRRSVLRALWRGNFARRRLAPRRSDERHAVVTDWFHAQWLAISILILLLCGADALLTLTLRVVNVNAGCAAVPNANVEIWHVDAAGDYSQYGTQTTQTFLRGIQTTNSNGEVTFTTIYPGWYQGRATHIHVEVTMAGRSVKATQIAFPESINNTVHASGVYASRGTNPMSNLADGIFSDSLSSEIVTPSGSAGSGYTASFQVAISA